MIQAALGIVEKMKIETFKTFSQKSASDTIFVQLNPNKFVISQQVQYDKSQPTGNTITDLKYNKTQSQISTFEFLFDSTGVVPPGQYGSSGGGSFGAMAAASNPYSITPARSLAKDLKDFKDLLLGYQSSTHEPPYLTLTWGAFILKCRLVEIEIVCTLFNSQGEPIRATANCKFCETAPVDFVLKKQNKSSPDLTHERVFKMGDSLPLMATEIYGSQDYYTDVAKANKLLSFRHINTGEKLFFPPIK